LKNAVHKTYNKLGIKSDRTKNITKHVLLSFVYKGGSILASFLLVPLTINYLDTENYGIWLTLSSFIAWFSFFDIGLGNGLRNKFAEAKAIGDMTLAKGYVSSAYFTIGAVSSGLIVIFTALNFLIDWTKVFNASPTLQKDLNILMPIVFGFLCLQLVVKLITTIYTADQHHSMQGKINFFIQVGSLLLIWIMTKTSESSLLVFGVIFSALPVVILLWFNLFAFNNRYIDFKPSIKLWKKEYLKEIFGLGFIFFVIQISGIVLYTTDNFIISKLFSPKEVVPYTIAFKYISISSMLFSIIATPYWSSINEAFNRKDFEWIKKAMKNLKKMSFIFVFLIFFMVIISKLVYQFWIGTKISIPSSLTIFMALFIVSSIIVTPYTIFLNGTGKIKIQAIQSVIAALINIPLSIFFAKTLNIGVNGIILATIVCFIPSLIFSQIQYSKIINNKAFGIWNK
jgi:O-antigen/teichoic acid export membrane protein